MRSVFWEGETSSKQKRINRIKSYRTRNTRDTIRMHKKKKWKQNSPWFVVLLLFASTLVVACRWFYSERLYLLEFHFGRLRILSMHLLWSQCLLIVRPVTQRQSTKISSICVWNMHTRRNNINRRGIQYNTIQYNTIQYNTIQYNTIQYNTIHVHVHILYIFCHY